MWILFLSSIHSFLLSFVRDILNRLIFFRFLLSFNNSFFFSLFWITSLSLFLFYSFFHFFLSFSIRNQLMHFGYFFHSFSLVFFLSFPYFNSPYGFINSFIRFSNLFLPLPSLFEITLWSLFLCFFHYSFSFFALSILNQLCFFSDSFIFFLLFFSLY